MWKQLLAVFLAVLVPGGIPVLLLGFVVRWRLAREKAGLAVERGIATTRGSVSSLLVLDTAPRWCQR